MRSMTWRIMLGCVAVNLQKVKICRRHQGYLNSEGKVILKYEVRSNTLAEWLFFTYLHGIKARIRTSADLQHGTHPGRFTAIKRGASVRPHSRERLLRSFRVSCDGGKKDVKLQPMFGNPENHFVSNQINV